MKRYLFAVYDDHNRVVQIYAEETRAVRKLKGREDWRIEVYVHEKHAKEISGYEYL